MPREGVLRFALVENHLRYGGENGIRFHPMGVRAISSALPVSSGQRVDYAFDVDAISTNLKTYLVEYEVRNDRYGPIKFVEKKFAIDAAGLSVVAFLQDASGPHVLQSAIVTVVPKHSGLCVANDTHNSC